MLAVRRRFLLHHQPDLPVNPFYVNRQAAGKQPRANSPTRKRIVELFAYRTKNDVVACFYFELCRVTIRGFERSCNDWQSIVRGRMLPNRRVFPAIRLLDLYIAHQPEPEAFHGFPLETFRDWFCVRTGYDVVETIEDFHDAGRALGRQEIEFWYRAALRAKLSGFVILTDGNMDPKLLEREDEEERRNPKPQFWEAAYASFRSETETGK